MRRLRSYVPVRTDLGRDGRVAKLEAHRDGPAALWLLLRLLIDAESDRADWRSEGGDASLSLGAELDRAGVINWVCRAYGFDPRRAPTVAKWIELLENESLLVLSRTFGGPREDLRRTSGGPRGFERFDVIKFPSSDRLIYPGSDTPEGRRLRQQRSRSKAPGPKTGCNEGRDAGAAVCHESRDAHVTQSETGSKEEREPPSDQGTEGVGGLDEIDWPIVRAHLAEVDRHPDRLQKAAKQAIVDLHDWAHRNAHRVPSGAYFVALREATRATRWAQVHGDVQKPGSYLLRLLADQFGGIILSGLDGQALQDFRWTPPVEA